MVVNTVCAAASSPSGKSVAPAATTAPSNADFVPLRMSHPQLTIIEAMVPCYRDADKHDSYNRKWFSPGVLLQHQFALHAKARGRIGALASRNRSRCCGAAQA